MNDEKIFDKLVEKKIDGYSVEDNNFSIPSELTVTITLNEYRELVSAKATRDHEISKANRDKYERENKITELTSEIGKLKEIIYNLREVQTVNEPVDNPAERGEF